MTQKELLYLEDAIKHEENMICFLNNCISNLEDQDLISFLTEEIDKHESFKDDLLEFLEVNASE